MSNENTKAETVIQIDNISNDTKQIGYYFTQETCSMSSSDSEEFKITIPEVIIEPSTLKVTKKIQFIDNTFKKRYQKYYFIGYQ